MPVTPTDNFEKSRSSDSSPNADIRSLIRAERRISLRSFKLNILLFAVALAFIGVSLVFSSQVESLVSFLEARYINVFHPMMTSHSLWVLPVVGFLGGLIASVSPCIMALSPLGAAVMGALEAPDQRRACLNAFSFTLGVVLILSLYGLISSFAGMVVVTYKGWINILVGLVAILIGIHFTDFVRVPIPAPFRQLSSADNAFWAGVTFALVTSPCASPVLFSLLNITCNAQNHFIATMTMTSYALGYTFILFLIGFFIGSAKRVQGIRQYQGLFTQISGFVLILIGLYHIANGLHWLYAS